MKKPRLEDFDPNAVPDLGSPLDDMPVIEHQPPVALPPQQSVSPTVMPKDVSSPPQAQPTPPRMTEPPPQAQPLRLPARPYGSTPVRTITRYAFELFQDQVDTLRRFSLEEKLRNEKGSMSEMVREALDMYISKRNRMGE